MKDNSLLSSSRWLSHASYLIMKYLISIRYWDTTQGLCHREVSNWRSKASHLIRDVTPSVGVEGWIGFKGVNSVWDKEIEGFLPRRNGTDTCRRHGTIVYKVKVTRAPPTPSSIMLKVELMRDNMEEMRVKGGKNLAMQGIYQEWMVKTSFIYSTNLVF